MTLADQALATNAERTRGPRSRLAAALDDAAPKLRTEAEEVLALVADGTVMSTVAAEILGGALGVKLSGEQVRRHVAEMET